MQQVIKLAIAASLVAGAAAQPHNHQHLHQHARKHQHGERGSPTLEERELQVEYAMAVSTVYVIDGQIIDSSDAVEGLKDGEYKIIGESTPTPTTPTSSIVPTTSSVVSSSTAAASSAAAGEFIEVKIGLSSAETTTSSSTSAAAATSAAATTSVSSSSTSSSSSGTGVDSDFPDGELDCDTFPSDYGAVCLDNTGLDCWAGLLDVGTDAYTLGSSTDIESFSEAVSGGASSGMFATYACPAGYDMAQWPEAQGSTGQSIGGLWCGSDNKLHLTRSSTSKKLCQKGAGNIFVTSKLSKDCYICKTQYPGTESMVLPTLVSAGATVELYNPYQDDSYSWNGASTSAQFYANLQGLSVDEACVWSSPDPYSGNAGNWAGINIGTSVDSSGTTYLSVFHNTPTSDEPLNYNIALSGDISSDCSYDYSSNLITGDSDGNNGCTVSTTGDIYITLSD